MSTDVLLFDVRPITPGDVNMILSTWLKGLRYGNEWFKLIEAEIYFKVYGKALESILYHPNTLVNVACLKDDPTVVLGYCVYNKQAVHWVFVKRAWRNIGIAKTIVPKDLNIATHLTALGKSILLKKKMIFNPFLLT